MKATRTLEDVVLEPYLHLFEDNDINIEFLYGTRDSGKSKAAAQLFIYDYSKIGNDFKGVLIRKVKDTIKDSVYANVSAVIDEWKIADYFDSTKSPLEIRSKIDNGVILCRGLDEVGKIKSLSNPTHALIEEGDQITLDDFTTLLTTFRHNTIKPKFYFLFNPELPKGISKKEDWWLWKNWFSHTDEKSFVNIKQIEYIDNGVKKIVELKYRATHTTFEQNKYCPPERKAHYYNLQFTNPEKYLPYAKGEWGFRSIENPFFYAFREDLHFKDERYQLADNKMIYLSFDFNANPTTLVIGQIQNKEIAVIDLILADENTMTGKSPLEAVCLKFIEKYLNTGLITRPYIVVTGDASGRSKSADNVANKNFYSKIRNVLQIGESQIKVRKANVTHELSREICNSMIYSCDFAIYRSAQLLIHDMNNAFVDDNGTLTKAKKEHGLHITDAFRYLVDCVLNFEKWQEYVRFYQKK